MPRHRHYCRRRRHVRVREERRQRQRMECDIETMAKNYPVIFLELVGRMRSATDSLYSVYVSTTGSGWKAKSGEGALKLLLLRYQVQCTCTCSQEKRLEYHDAEMPTRKRDPVIQ